MLLIPATVALLLLLTTLTSSLGTPSFSSASSNPPKGFTGVRFSVYPKVSPDESAKAVVKDVVRNLSDLGLEARPDDVSTVLLGPEPALFEAVRVALGRAASRATVEDDDAGHSPRQVSMQCTFSAGCPGEPDGPPLPPRAVVVDEDGEGRDWVDEAYRLPKRVACQFAVYPLGSDRYMDTIRDVIDAAKGSPAFVPGVKTHFCTMLDGDGGEVFDVLRSSFALARERHLDRGGAGHVTMTATLTANKSSWSAGAKKE